MLFKTQKGVFICKFRHEREKSNPTTECHLRMDGQEKAWIGISRCDARDSFQKHVGRKISLTRALESAKLDRETRQDIWMEYFRSITG